MYCNIFPGLFLAIPSDLKIETKHTCIVIYSGLLDTYAQGIPHELIF